MLCGVSNDIIKNAISNRRVLHVISKVITQMAVMYDEYRYKFMGACLTHPAAAPNN
jgi:hypothetical protein